MNLHPSLLRTALVHTYLIHLIIKSPLKSQQWLSLDKTYVVPPSGITKLDVQGIYICVSIGITKFIVNREQCDKISSEKEKRKDKISTTETLMYTQKPKCINQMYI